MQEYCFKKPNMRFMVKPFKFSGFCNICEVQFFNKIRGYVPQEKTCYDLKEAGTLEVILIIDLKGNLSEIPK